MTLIGRNSLRFMLLKSLFYWIKVPLYVSVLLCVLSDLSYAANVDLIPLINDTPHGGSLSLDPENTYLLSEGIWLNKSITIEANGATIVQKGPINLKEEGATLKVVNGILTSEGWSALAVDNGGALVVRNCTISCPEGTGIHATGATVTVENGTITSCKYGINMFEGHSGTTAELHGVTITNCPFAVQSGGVLSSVTIDQNSLLSYFDYRDPNKCDSTGVGLIDGASGFIQNSTINGFSNGIDKLPPSSLEREGTIKVVNCYFSKSEFAAFSVGFAEDVLFSNCTVENVIEDGLFLRKSTGMIEDSKFLDSAMTGVTIWGCKDGATIRNCVIKNSGHQGLSIVSDTTVSHTTGLGNGSPIPSRGIQVIGNTIINSQLTNLLVDEYSTATLQGNIFWKASWPSVGIRLQGPKQLFFESTLVGGSDYGFKMKFQSTPEVCLSAITKNNYQGVHAYDGASFTIRNSFVEENNLSKVDDIENSSIYLTGGGSAVARDCSFGPSGDRAVYNFSGNTCDVEYNFWASAKGPSGDGGGDGAMIGHSGESTVDYYPYLTQAPLDFNLKSNVSMSSGEAVIWDSSLGVKVELTPYTGCPTLASEITGVLRINDTDPDHLGVTAPSNLIPGRLYTVWVSTLMRINSSSGSLRFKLPSQTENVGLQRRDVDGNWVQVRSTWDSSAHVLTYSPDDIHSLNGIFGLCATTMYVCSDGICGGKPNCYTTVESAVRAAQTDALIKVANNGTYSGEFTASGKTLTIQGGWNTSFGVQSGTTTLQGLPIVSNGSLTMQQVNVIP